MTITRGWEIPSEDQVYSDFHWFHVPARGSLVLVVVGESVVTYVGHYVDGRMWPCVGDGCELCGRGLGRQARFVFPVAEPLSRRVGLLELGRGNGLQLRDWAGRNGGLKGLSFEVGKEGTSRQSRTVIHYIDQPQPISTVELPVPDPFKALYFTWRRAHLPIPPAMSDALSAEGL